MSNSDQTMTTGVGPLDAAIGWGFYLLYALPIFFLSIFICVMFVVPQLGPDTGIVVFVIWFCTTIYLLGKSK